MDLHQNARSCPASRAVLVERVMMLGRSVRAAARRQLERLSGANTIMGVLVLACVAAMNA